jgi:hypothetical protein
MPLFGTSGGRSIVRNGIPAPHGTDGDSTRAAARGFTTKREKLLRHGLQRASGLRANAAFADGFGRARFMLPGRLGPTSILACGIIRPFWCVWRERAAFAGARAPGSGLGLAAFVRRALLAFRLSRSAAIGSIT